MKKVLLSLCLLMGWAATDALAQIPYDKEKKQIIYTEVVETPGLNKDQLYENALVALRDIYVGADKKITSSDKAAGKIILNGFTKFVYKDKKGKELVDPNFIRYKLAISFKDGKYKYEFYDFHQDAGGYKIPMEKLYTREGASANDLAMAEEKLAYMDQDIRKIIEQLKPLMLGKAEEKKSDW